MDFNTIFQSVCEEQNILDEDRGELFRNIITNLVKDNYYSKKLENEIRVRLKEYNKHYDDSIKEYNKTVEDITKQMNSLKNIEEKDKKLRIKLKEKGYKYNISENVVKKLIENEADEDLKNWIIIRNKMKELKKLNKTLRTLNKPLFQKNFQLISKTFYENILNVDEEILWNLHIGYKQIYSFNASISTIKKCKFKFIDETMNKNKEPCGYYSDFDDYAEDTSNYSYNYVFTILCD
jgi:hypothetical protein